VILLGVLKPFTTLDFGDKLIDLSSFNAD